MRFTNLVGRVGRILDAIINVIAWIGAGALVLMVFVILANVGGRFLFKKPLLGAVETVGLLTVILVFCIMAFTESERAHITVDIIPSRLPARLKSILASVMCLLGAVFFIIMGWQGWELMWTNLFPSVIASGVLSIPFAPIMFIMGFGCVLFGLELLVHVFIDPESDQHKQV